MNARTLKALNESIEHWKRHASGTARKGEGIWSEDCALCKRFVRKTSLLTGSCCHGCPISQKTGMTWCKGTPWMEAEKEYMLNPSGARFKARAQDMVEFLKSLLPKTSKPKPRKVAKKK